MFGTFTMSSFWAKFKPTMVQSLAFLYQKMENLWPLEEMIDALWFGPPKSDNYVIHDNKTLILAFFNQFWPFFEVSVWQLR